MYEWNGASFQGRLCRFSPTKDIKAGVSPATEGAVRALYDIVLNGTELGSGSIHGIHPSGRPGRDLPLHSAYRIQTKKPSPASASFLGNIEVQHTAHDVALGLNRIVMILAGAQSLREVIAFPKTAKAIDLMVDAPPWPSNNSANSTEI